MKKVFEATLLMLYIGIFLTSCKKDTIEPPSNEKKEFKSSFETIDDFSGFYITPQISTGTVYNDDLNIIEVEGE